MKWQPIETAPRDDDFLVAIRSDSITAEYVVCQACWWVDEIAVHSEQHFGYFPLRDFRRATHWMPLPEPPEVTSLMIEWIKADKKLAGTALFDDITESDEFKALWAEVKASGDKALLGNISAAMGAQ